MPEKTHFPPRPLETLTPGERRTLARHPSGSSFSHDNLLETLERGMIQSCSREPGARGFNHRVHTTTEGDWLVSDRAFAALADQTQPPPSPCSAPPST